MMIFFSKHIKIRLIDKHIKIRLIDKI